MKIYFLFFLVSLSCIATHKESDLINESVFKLKKGKSSTHLSVLYHKEQCVYRILSKIYLSKKDLEHIKQIFPTRDYVKKIVLFVPIQSNAKKFKDQFIERLQEKDFNVTFQEGDLISAVWKRV